MRSFLLGALMVCMLVSVNAQARPDTTLQLTIDECIDIALQQNEQIKITSLEKEISNAEVRKTISEGLPQASVNANVNYNFQQQKSIFDAGSSPFPIAGSQPGDLVTFSLQQPYDANFGLRVSQLIFDGSYFVGLQAARTYRELSIKDHKANEIDVVANVSTAYYTVLVNQERLELLNANYQRLDTLLRQTRALNENGFAEKIDVDRIRVNLNNVSVERQRLEKLTDLSFKLLKFQMGIDLNVSLALTTTLGQVGPQRELIPVEPIDYNNRIEYSKLTTNENLALLDIRNNAAQYLPKLYANANWSANTASTEFSQVFESDRWRPFGAVGLSLTIPIFDGFLKSNRIQQNRLQLEQLKQQKLFMEKNINLEIEQSLINLNSSMEAMEVQKQNMELASDIYRMTQIRYTQGLGANLEVVEADADLIEAQTNYYNALFDAMVAEIELKKALGILHN